MSEQIDPALWERPDVQPVLSGRDVGALYRRLKDDAGLVQRQIAALTGQTQSEVSEVLRGRQVIAYEVLEAHRHRSGHPPGADGPVLVGSGRNLVRP